jgi:hypothetical protein
MKEGILLIFSLALTANAIHLNLNHDQTADLFDGFAFLVANAG